VILPNSGFEANYDEIEFLKYSYDVISVTSSPLRHRKTSLKLRHKILTNLGPPIKISGYASV